jgi:cell pole-organizing protein PopZ
MEEILASIRRIIADDQDGPKAAEPPRPAAPEPEDDDDDVLDLAEAATPVARAPLPDLDFDHEDVSFKEEEPEEVDFDSISFDDAPEPEPEIEEPAYQPPPPPPRFEPASAAERLTSQTTDAAVSQAFNMLAHTVLTNNARTLEDLVREMLKPMLKVWLDDNLPPLVERLVRSEIERVARGGR